MLKLYSLLFLLFSILPSLFGQSDSFYRIISGYVSDTTVLEEKGIAFVKLSLKNRDKQVHVFSDINGYYKFMIPEDYATSEDTLSLEIRSIGYETQIIKEIKLDPHKTLRIDIELQVREIPICCLGCYMKPIIDIDPINSGKTIVRGEDLKHAQF